MSNAGYTEVLIRHNGPRDFVKDCVVFDARPCSRCGHMPERAEWLTCMSCRLDFDLRHKPVGIGKAAAVVNGIKRPRGRPRKVLV